MVRDYDKEFAEAVASAEEELKDMPPGEERDELRAFLISQYGGLKNVGEMVRRHKPRVRRTTEEGE